jgi:hypothetical protein
MPGVISYNPEIFIAAVLTASAITEQERLKSGRSVGEANFTYLPLFVRIHAAI